MWVECDVDQGTWRLFEARCADTGETPAERLAKALQWALAPGPEPGEFPGLEAARACAKAGEDGIAPQLPSPSAVLSPDTTEFEAEFEGLLQKYGLEGIPRSDFADLAPEFALRLDLQDRLAAYTEHAEADGETVSLAAFLDFAREGAAHG